MDDNNDFEFEDVQGLVRFGHGRLTETRFMLLDIVDVAAAKQWLAAAPVTNACTCTPLPETALQIAFSAPGLRALGLHERIVEQFSDEFITGISGDESRSRRLGDIDDNAPQKWDWGGDAARIPHVLLLLYAQKGGIDAWQRQVEGNAFARAFKRRSELPTFHIGDIEPFGFRDGISQPQIDWAHTQSTDLHDRDRYSNLVAPSEVVLGYPNEYGLYTPRPLIDPTVDTHAKLLADAEDAPSMKDFGRNGSYLVIRQLSQDVPGFWQFLDKATGAEPDPIRREQLAAAMVGRTRDGSPLVAPADQPIPGVPADDRNNQFTFDHDPAGFECPIGAHIRRSNPRTGDLPPGPDGLLGRLKRILGFGLESGDDLVASSRFHRLLRRARTYGSPITPEAALDPDAASEERGLQFICLVANISRQFEFVQNAWTMSTRFGGVQRESDPLLGNRRPLITEAGTDRFNRPDPAGPVQTVAGLPQFVTVRGGGYFFMPGLRALKYLWELPNRGRSESS